MDRVVFVDTGFLIALAAPRDRLHPQAVVLAEQVQQSQASLLTTRAVLLELGAALSGSHHRQTAANMLSAIEADPAIEIESITDTLYSEALALFTRHADKEWRLTDCISFTVMRRRDIQSALTADKHFSQAGFTALMQTV